MEIERRIDFIVVGTQKLGTTTLDAYLRQHPNIQMGANKEIRFFDDEKRYSSGTPNLPAQIKKQYVNSSITFSTKPLDIKKIAKECDFGLSHAGHDTLLNLLIFGKPLLLFPTQLEQYVLSKRVEEAGAGFSTIEGTEENQVAQAIKELSSNKKFYAAAEQIAKKYAEQFQTSPLSQLLNRCEELIKP